MSSSRGGWRSWEIIHIYLTSLNPINGKFLLNIDLKVSEYKVIDGLYVVIVEEDCLRDYAIHCGVN